MSFRVPMSAPDITPADTAAVHAVLNTPHLSMGPRIDEFERCFAAYTGTAFAAAVNSGTSGLHLAAIAAGIGPGDLAITTPFSFVASANCLLYGSGPLAPEPSRPSWRWTSLASRPTMTCCGRRRCSTA